MNRPALLAGEIARLARNRQEVVQHALASLEFARDHTFEKTFRRRIDQVKAVAMINGEVLTPTVGVQQELSAV
jgi:hypothetical protein